MEKIIAVTHCVYKSAEGEMRPIRIYVRAPYKLGDEEWGSYCHVDGLFDNEIQIHGGSSMQALCLALAFLRLRLRSFEEQGGTYYDPEDMSSPLLAEELFGDILPTQGCHPQTSSRSHGVPKKTHLPYSEVSPTNLRQRRSAGAEIAQACRISTCLNKTTFG